MTPTIRAWECQNNDSLKSGNKVILFPSRMLFNDSLIMSLFLWLTWNINLCSLWSNWTEITYNFIFILKSSHKDLSIVLSFNYYLRYNIFYVLSRFQTSLYIHFSLLFVFNTLIKSINLIVYEIKFKSSNRQ